jgi:serine/threonine protein kinase
MFSCGVVLYVMLSGRMPFYGRNDVECLRRTAEGKYSFPDREWSSISDAAMSLVRALLQDNADKRLTARAALQHIWLAEPEHNSAVPIENDLRDLHSTRRKFRKAVNSIAAVQKLSAAVAAAATSSSGGSGL